MIVEELLPIKKMTRDDWYQIHTGFVIGSSGSDVVPHENTFCGHVIEYLLNTNLKLSSYTNNYREFHFNALSFLNKGMIRRPNKVNILDQQIMMVLELEVSLDVPRLINVNKHEALQMIAQLMLDSIPQYLFNRTDFDGQKFYDDILPIIKPIADGIRTFQDEEFPL